MKMLLEFDINGDIIDVPQAVIDRKDQLRSRFLKWLYNKSVRHQYWVRIPDRNGGSYEGVMFRGDAFVEWLNKKVLCGESERATLLQQFVNIDEYKSQLPSIFF